MYPIVRHKVGVGGGDVVRRVVDGGRLSRRQPRFEEHGRRDEFQSATHVTTVSTVQTRWHLIRRDHRQVYTFRFLLTLWRIEVHFIAKDKLSSVLQHHLLLSHIEQ